MFLYKWRVFGKDNEYRKLVITGSELDMYEIRFLTEAYSFCSNISRTVRNNLFSLLWCHLTLIFSFNYIFLISKISYSLNFLVFMTSHHSLKIPVFCSSRILALFAPLSTCVAVHLVRIILSHRPCVCHCQISLMNLRASHSVTHWASLFRLRIFFF